MIRNVSLPYPVNVIVKKIPADAIRHDRINWYEADLLQLDSYIDIFKPGDVVLNFAFMTNLDADANLLLIDNVIEACKRNRVEKLIHCSTAMVIGTANETVITEEAICNPGSIYESIKYQVEKRIMDAFQDEEEVYILRPTAIVGYGGKNLVKIIDSLAKGNGIYNYLKACLNGNRHMHLVPVETVVNAILFLIGLARPIGKNIFFISADDEPLNNYVAIEGLLQTGMGIRHRRFKVIKLPLQILRLLLKLSKRDAFLLDKKIDDSKIRNLGFKRKISLSEAIINLGARYR
jgi:nucleoside-diphosphate-sugar epimerase